MVHAWAAILAGGNGSRLKAVTTAEAGDGRPKQFCRLLSGSTLLDDTRTRVAKVIDPAQTMLVLNVEHRDYYRESLLSTPPDLLIEQPGNAGTAPAIAYALGRVRRADPDAVLAVFPSDHHYSDGESFEQALKIGLAVAAIHPDRLMLVGAVPDTPESEYGWIVPGATAYPFAAHRVSRVTSFREKPNERLARQLQAQGGLWNTFITIGSVEAFQSVLGETKPALAEFAAAVTNGAPSAEADLAARTYESQPSTCFSRDVLSHVPERCLVVRMAGAGWLDIGHPGRLSKARAARSA